MQLFSIGQVTLVVTTFSMMILVVFRTAIGELWLEAYLT